MTNYLPYTIAAAPEVAMAQTSHRHLLALQAIRNEALRVHALLHIIGAEESRDHTEVMEALVQIESDIDRGIAAIWS